MNFLKPDYIIDHFSTITPTWLKERNIHTIISDLDSTLTIHNGNGNDTFAKWLQTLLDEEITLIIVSNNSQERVDVFSNTYKIVGYGNCHKPRTHVIEKQLFQKGLRAEHTLFLGDQVFTDIWCGKRLGVQTALVRPIPGEEPITIRFKRLIESKLLQQWGKAK